MGSSILDYLDSNWGSLLGMNQDPSAGQNQATASPNTYAGFMGPGGQGAFSGPPPLPPQQAMPPPPMASTSTPFVDDLGNPIPSAAGAGAPTMPPPGAAPPGAANAATPPGGGVSTVPMTNPPGAPSAPPGVPLPQPRPQNIPTDTGPVSTAALPPAQTIPSRPVFAGGGGPPPPPPPGAYGTPPPLATTGAGMNGAFGLSPVQSALAGVGRGLERVGQLRFGASGAQAFAAGAGGGLAGGIADQERQQLLKRQLQNDLFNQRSIAYKDMLDGMRTGDNHQVAVARSNYLDANRALRQSGARDVFSGTPYAKARDLENALDKEDESLRKRIGEQMNALAKERQAGFGDSDVQEQEYARLKKELQDIPNTRDQRRQDRAKRLGIPTDEFKRGTDKNHAFDADSMTEEQRLHMPEGAIFKHTDENGNVVYGKRDYSTKPPYEGWQRPQGPEQQQQPGPTAQSKAISDALWGQDTDQQNAA